MRASIGEKRRLDELIAGCNPSIDPALERPDPCEPQLPQRVCELRCRGFVGTRAIHNHFANYDYDMRLPDLCGLELQRRIADCSELPVMTKQFHEESFIQRINTSGGSAPATGCASLADVGNKQFVHYTADYVFFTSDHDRRY